MGFASYFLIVWDFVRFAREQGIPNSARGSACGALVSYLLYLSHVDPLKYDLLFERFLDPNRSEAPDIDIDLCKERRYEVIEYVRRKYGAANVAQIGTFGTMAAKAALKDVGRALNIPLARVDQVTKLVPQRLNITLEEALEGGARPEAAGRRGPRDRQAARLRPAAGRHGPQRQHPRRRGRHRRPPPRCDLVPLQKIPNKDKDKEVVSTQWEMGDVEKAGLLKMDFLGLRNLTSLAAAVRLIERRRGAPLDLFGLPLDDEATYKLLQRGDAKGIFQLDGGGHPRPAGQDEARPLRRPDRHPGPVPPRPAQRRHGRRLRQPQARARDGRLSPPGDEGGPGRDLRRDGLPGAGDADPQPPGGHRALAGVRDASRRSPRRRPRSSPRAASSSSRGPSRGAWTGTRPPRSST